MTIPGSILLAKLKNCCKSSSGKSAATPHPYSPDLVRSDYFLFPKLKDHLSRARFSSDSDVKTAAENWLNEQGRDFYQAWLNQLVLRADKCLNRFGD
ncbi:hypothetical protein AVEN_189284-1 [Araneus ventricosus]|uniref:Histone-lysine N-methyltransferase SETMAR n=1 Tax=Araneus ventricosus TaxID=182803 RepID=A0A4Y2MWF1_ARAVE|nr:hypothetical protein AVEN_189284-1 [Araneus ventricosus]